MRSPRGLGVGRLGATFIASVLALTALAATPALGNHHLESEGAAEEPKASKIMVIAPDEFTGLVGARRTFWASICNQEGSGCKDAKKAKWSVVPRKGLALSKKKGRQISAEGVKEGSYELTAKQNGVVGTVTVKINEPPQLQASGPSADEQRLYLWPEMRTLDVGEVGVFDAFGCILGNGGRLGQNGIPDGVDDGCVRVDIEQINLPDGAPVEIVGPFDSTFGLMPTGFPSDVAGDVAFVGPQVVTPIGSTALSVQVRNQPFLDAPVLTWFEGDGDGNIVSSEPAEPQEPEPGSLAGPADQNSDNQITMWDYWIWRAAVIGDTVATPESHGQLDVDGNGEVDERDGRLIQLRAFQMTMSPLGDTDRDLVVGDKDQDSAYATFLMGRYDPALDVDGDLVLDQADWDGLGYGQQPMPTPFHDSRPGSASS